MCQLVRVYDFEKRFHTDEIGLKLVLLRAQAGPLFLPKVVRLDDVGRMYDIGEKLLEHLEY